MSSHRVLLELTRRYSEPHRHYHGLPHIAWMLDAGRAFPLTDEQVLAVWFHDAVYDPHSATNEEDSAALAVELLSAEGYPAASVETVRGIVLDTKAHRASTPAAEPVIDLDLGSLALPWAGFEANTDRIRREYAHLSEAELDRGRRAMFEELLARERIFTTPWGAPREAAARANLARSLQR